MVGERYFNLKIGNEKVYGGVIKVDPSADLEHRLSDFYDDCDGYKFNHVKSYNKQDVYDLIIPNVEYHNNPGKDALGGDIGVPVSIEVGKPTLLKIAVKRDGVLELIAKPEGINVYLSEITEASAKKLKEGKRCWDIMRAYIYE